MALRNEKKSEVSKPHVKKKKQLNEVNNESKKISKKENTNKDFTNSNNVNVKDNLVKNQVLDRKQRKEIAEKRKEARRPNYDLEKEIFSKWEILRNRKTEPEKRSKLVSEILAMSKGKISEFVVSHTISRVIQSCLKYCKKEERDAIFDELRPHCLDLAKNVYAHHLVNKMIEHGNKAQQTQMMNQFRGQVVALLKHPSASGVIENAYSLANSQQKQNFICEFYLPEFRLLRGNNSLQVNKLMDIYTDADVSKKKQIINHIWTCVKSILEKQIFFHSIIHKILAEFIKIAPKNLMEEVMEYVCSPSILQLIHTHDGVHVACTAVAFANAKERKKIVKSLKDNIGKIARDNFGNILLLKIFDTVDDTVLVRKVIISEYLKELLPLSLDKFGKRIILHLLAPRSTKYFPSHVIQELEEMKIQIQNQNDNNNDIIKSKTEGNTEGAEGKGEGGSENKQKEDTEVQEDGEGEEDDGKEESEGIEKDEDTETEGKETKEGQGGKGLELRGLSKKDAMLKRTELLKDGGLAEKLVELCISHTDELLRSQDGGDVIYEVARGGHDGILWQMIPQQISAVHVAILELAKKNRKITNLDPNSLTLAPKPGQKRKKTPPKNNVVKKYVAFSPLPSALSLEGEDEKEKKNEEMDMVVDESEGREGENGTVSEDKCHGEGERGGEEEEEEDHILDEYFANRVLRKLVLNSCPSSFSSQGILPFSALLWTHLFSKECQSWAKGHSAKVLAAMAACDHEETKVSARSELKILAKSGKLEHIKSFLPSDFWQEVEAEKKREAEAASAGSVQAKKLIKEQGKGKNKKESTAKSMMNNNKKKQPFK